MIRYSLPNHCILYLWNDKNTLVMDLIIQWSQKQESETAIAPCLKLILALNIYFEYILYIESCNERNKFLIQYFNCSGNNLCRIKIQRIFQKWWHRSFIFFIKSIELMNVLIGVLTINMLLNVLDFFLLSLNSILNQF